MDAYEHYKALDEADVKYAHRPVSIPALRCPEGRKEGRKEASFILLVSVSWWIGSGIEADTHKYSTDTVSSELHSTSLGWRQVVMSNFAVEGMNVDKVTYQW